MAVVQRKAAVVKYKTADENLQTGFGGVFDKLDKTMDVFRPSLADNQKVGFFSQDRTSQTNVTEIVNLKEMTKLLRDVLGDVKMLRREIQLSKQIIKADYDAKIKNKSIELYSRVNERIEQVEKLADERVDHIRRAFRQQLSNTITRLSSIYQNEMEKRIKKLQKDKLGDAAGLLDKYNELEQINQRNESMIQMLRTQLIEAMTKPPPVVEEKEEVYRSSPTPDNNNEEEMEELRDEIQQLETKVQNLMEQLDVKDEHASQQKMEIDNLKDALEREKITIQQLRHENDEMKASFDQDKTASRRQLSEEHASLLKEVNENDDQILNSLLTHRALSVRENFSTSVQGSPLPFVSETERLEAILKGQSSEVNLKSERTSGMSDHFTMVTGRHGDSTRSAQGSAITGYRSYVMSADSGYHDHGGLEKQRLELEKEMEMKMQKVSEEVSASAEGNLQSLLASEQEKIQLLVNQNRKLEQQLAEIRAKVGQKTKEQKDTEVNKFREEKMSSEITRLKKEIDRVHRSWEKKFSILQNSLHALKDESYVRQSLQRQAAALHHAAISYAVDTPLGIRPTKQTPRKPPLPDITKSGKGGDYYSYTLSGQSNKFQSVDENQIISDGDTVDIPQDVTPLPEPPVRLETETSRPSTSHVVVLPTA